MTSCSTGPTPSLSPNWLCYLVATGPAAKARFSVSLSSLSSLRANATFYLKPSLSHSRWPAQLSVVPSNLHSLLARLVPDKPARVPSTALQSSQAVTSWWSPIATSGHPPRNPKPGSRCQAALYSSRSFPAYSVLSWPALGSLLCYHSASRSLLCLYCSRRSWPRSDSLQTCRATCAPNCAM